MNKKERGFTDSVVSMTGGPEIGVVDSGLTVTTVGIGIIASLGGFDSVDMDVERVWRVVYIPESAYIRVNEFLFFIDFKKKNSWCSLFGITVVHNVWIPSSSKSRCYAGTKALDILLFNRV